MPTRLALLPTKPSVAHGHAVVVNAPWRYLTGAHRSVQAVLTIFDDVHASVAKARGERRGTLRQEEQELLRAALVLTSSGLDASMHKLVRVALPRLITRGASAATRYQTWLQQELTQANGASKPIVQAALSPDATKALVDAYVAEQTAGSYQGTGDLAKRVRDVLGIPSSLVNTTSIDALAPFFIARNAIVHDMDYVNTSDSSRRSRHTRAGAATLAECDRAFGVCAGLIAAAATRFNPAPPAVGASTQGSVSVPTATVGAPTEGGDPHG